MSTVIDARTLGEQVQAVNLSQTVGKILAACPVTRFFCTKLCVGLCLPGAKKPVAIVKPQSFQVSPPEVVKAIAGTITTLPVEGVVKFNLVGGNLNVVLFLFFVQFQHFDGEQVPTRAIVSAYEGLRNSTFAPLGEDAVISTLCKNLNKEEAKRVDPSGLTFTNYQMGFNRRYIIVAEGKVSKRNLRNAYANFMVSCYSAYGEGYCTFQLARSSGQDEKKPLSLADQLNQSKTSMMLLPSVEVGKISMVFSFFF